MQPRQADTVKASRRTGAVKAKREMDKISKPKIQNKIKLIKQGNIMYS